MKVLTAGYFGLGVVGLAIAFLFRDNTQLVNSAVWIRTGAMIASAGLLYLFVERAARGQRRAFLRVRIVSIVVPLVIVALVFLPDPFPVWMKVQQARRRRLSPSPPRPDPAFPRRVAPVFARVSAHPAGGHAS